MKIRSVLESKELYLIIVAAVTSAFIPLVTTSTMANAQNESWTSSFNLEDCNFSTTGNNPYFILQPGYQLVFAGLEDGEPLNVTATVSNETKIVGDGIVARVVEERTVNSQTNDLKEITRDYFAICEQTDSVYYFGEDVDNYEGGKLVDHVATWFR